MIGGWFKRQQFKQGPLDPPSVGLPIFMRWYTLHWNNPDEGHCLEHFPTLKKARERKEWIQERNEGWFYDCNVEDGIDENSVQNKSDLLKWLNNNFTRDNG